ncbi:MAG: hypothetical protein VX044_06235 [Planctomycetota bacterium]|nr:hypothetical protein [Planctomycetota bacterium]
MSSTRELLARLVAALLVGVAGVVGLAFAVQAFDDRPKRTMRAKSAGQVDVGGRIATSFEMPRPGHAAAVGFELRPLVGTLAVSGRLDALPADVAPVIEVLPDGSLALRRSRPLAASPDQARRGSRSGDGAGVVLPGRRLGELSPEARGALGGLLVRWFPRRPVPAGRIRAVGFALPEPDLARLLAWLP